MARSWPIKSIKNNYFFSELGYAIKITAGSDSNLFHDNLFNSTLGELDDGSSNNWNNSVSGNFYGRVDGNGFSQIH